MSKKNNDKILDLIKTIESEEDEINKIRQKKEEIEEQISDAKVRLAIMEYRSGQLQEDISFYNKKITDLKQSKWVRY